MGKVEVVVLEGLDLWFNSSDHLPPHVHARRRGEWEIRVYFLLCTDDELAFDCKWAKKDPSAKVSRQNSQSGCGASGRIT